MEKTLVQMTAEIVAAQAGSGRVSPDELAVSIHQVYDALVEIHDKEQCARTEPEGEITGLPHLRGNPQKSVTRTMVICLECGMKFKQLTTRHLVTHGLNPMEYRAKWGFSKRQPLVARQLSAQRRRTALDNQLGERLAAARRRKLAEQV
ncbi:MAG: MucR family transcriptional regulator [Candidatus Eisenbacteria bacterium]|jgi:predicted transcriptional regulator|nr:MucR family transcriptional regulator [Candidatus Eisenbacteria bacterium]